MCQRRVRGRTLSPRAVGVACSPKPAWDGHRGVAETVISAENSLCLSPSLGAFFLLRSGALVSSIDLRSA